MHHGEPTDEQLLSARDAASFELLYGRHVESLLSYFSRRTRDAELSADLCAETFAAALAGRSRYRPDAGAAAATSCSPGRAERARRRTSAQEGTPARPSGEPSDKCSSTVVPPTRCQTAYEWFS